MKTESILAALIEIKKHTNYLDRDYAANKLDQVSCGIGALIAMLQKELEGV